MRKCLFHWIIISRLIIRLFINYGNSINTHTHTHTHLLWVYRKILCKCLTFSLIKFVAADDDDFEYCIITNYRLFCVILVSCVDLLKTKFSISLSELRPRPPLPAPPRDEYLSVSNRIFFSWTYVSVYSIFWSAQQLPLSGKSPIIPPPVLRLNFLLKETKNILGFISDPALEI